MTGFVSHTSFDCSNAYVLSEFWKVVLGYVDIEDDSHAPGHPECVIADPEGNEFCSLRSLSELSPQA